ncbi:MAG: endonuclease [Planctomycetota bacterium]|nr:endonuclease [Planctomycetota bacterium]
MTDVPHRLRRMVEERAGGRCEYCGLAQDGQEATFHIDRGITDESAPDPGHSPRRGTKRPSSSDVMTWIANQSRSSCFKVPIKIFSTLGATSETEGLVS